MTYLDAAVRILSAAKRPMTTREITERAVARGFIAPEGKTPEATMSAVLYRRVKSEEGLVKIATPGASRAQRGTVRWMVQPR
jgi:hypothetical protein